MSEPSSLQGHQLGDDPLKFDNGQWERDQIGFGILFWILILDQ